MANSSEACNVLSSVARAYMMKGFDEHEVIVNSIEDELSIFLPKMRRLEYIFPENSLKRLDLNRYENVFNSCLEVWILVPLSLLGEAHGLFRKKADWVQAWWVDGENLKFTSPERP